MSILNPAEWSKAMQKAVAVVTAIGVIIGGYLSVESWAESKITDHERRDIKSNAERDALNQINHSKIIQRERIKDAQVNIRITELQIEHLEEEIAEREELGEDPTDRQQRKMDRLTELVKTYDEVVVDATEKLAQITTVEQ